MVVIVSGIGGNELYVSYGQGGSELPSVTPLVTIAIISVFMMFKAPPRIELEISGYKAEVIPFNYRAR